MDNARDNESVRMHASFVREGESERLSRASDKSLNSCASDVARLSLHKGRILTLD